jgi:hypothetical protein
MYQLSDVVLGHAYVAVAQQQQVCAGMGQHPHQVCHLAVERIRVAADHEPAWHLRVASAQRCNHAQSRIGWVLDSEEQLECRIVLLEERLEVSSEPWIGATQWFENAHRRAVARYWPWPRRCHGTAPARHVHERDQTGHDPRSGADDEQQRQRLHGVLHGPAPQGRQGVWVHAALRQRDLCQEADLCNIRQLDTSSPVRV